MGMQLKNVVPFGRSLDEYRKMFLLTDDDLHSKILGAGDGPASFNAELTALGGNVVSVDPLYQFDAAEIRRRFDEVLPNIIEQIKATPNDWSWSYHRSPDDLRFNRIKTCEMFTNDFELNRGSPRYVKGQLPALDFRDSTFDLALCSHFLFLYSEHFDAMFHLAAIIEREHLRFAISINTH
ncbi:MAG: SAM-dependent methyltransferase [Cyanobacteria bacterium RI_101]|nr:SAM-dependent methyltransferase [Cyanobacteria bacterium RI_101]